MGKMVGCPHCLTFVTIGKQTIGLICSKCKKYFSKSSPWYCEEDFEKLKKKGAKLGSGSYPKMTPGKRALHQHMEKRARDYAKKVNNGGIPYNDPNK